MNLRCFLIDDDSVLYYNKNNNRIDHCHNWMIWFEDAQVFKLLVDKRSKKIHINVMLESVKYRSFTDFYEEVLRGKIVQEIVVQVNDKVLSMLISGDKGMLNIATIKIIDLIYKNFKDDSKVFS